MTTFAGLSTVTETWPLTVVSPAVSVATAVIVCGPLGRPLVLQLAVYGAVVSAAPTLVEPALNCTEATPPSSTASAVSGTVPETEAPSEGAVTDTAGGVTSVAKL